MKTLTITEPLIGYNSDGKRHRATHEALIEVRRAYNEADDLYRQFLNAAEFDSASKYASISITLLRVEAYLAGQISEL